METDNVATSCPAGELLLPDYVPVERQGETRSPAAAAAAWPLITDRAAHLTLTNVVHDCPVSRYLMSDLLTHWCGRATLPEQGCAHQRIPEALHHLWGDLELLVRQKTVRMC